MNNVSNWWWQIGDSVGFQKLGCWTGNNGSVHGMSLEGSISSAFLLKSKRVYPEGPPEQNHLLPFTSYWVTTNSFPTCVTLGTMADGSYNSHYVGLEAMWWKKQYYGPRMCLLWIIIIIPGGNSTCRFSYLLQVNISWFSIEWDVISIVRSLKDCCGVRF